MIKEEMLINIQVTTLVQIFCEFMINTRVIFKIVKSPDDSCQGDI